MELIVRGVCSKCSCQKSATIEILLNTKKKSRGTQWSFTFLENLPWHEDQLFFDKHRCYLLLILGSCTFSPRSYSLISELSASAASPSKLLCTGCDWIALHSFAWNFLRFHDSLGTVFATSFQYSLRSLFVLPLSSCHQRVDICGRYTFLPTTILRTKMRFSCDPGEHD